jgi:hypothetical protein
VKKILKTAAIIVSIPVVAYVLYFLYLIWPTFFPKYPVDSCVLDSQVQRIHKIKGFDDRYKGSGVPTIIVVSGMATPGSHEVGGKGSISIDDPHISAVRCP